MYEGMKVSDFRIGNLVLEPEDKPYYFPIEEIKKNAQGRLSVFYRNGSINTNEPDPIPLTEEWLIKFGFENSRDTWSIQKNKMCIDLWFNDDSKVKDLQISSTNISGAYPDIKNCQYVHQLQNLYFALTGEELNLL